MVDSTLLRRKKIGTFRTFGICLGLLFLCSCAAPTPVHPPLPAETYFNYGAGRGNPLLLTLHLEDGKPLLFVVDTGCNDTVLDKSLEPELGKRLYTYLMLKTSTAGRWTLQKAWRTDPNNHIDQVYPVP
jgi:hypothetical protein